MEFKILTLNTHSLIEENSLESVEELADFVADKMPDIIALQEVNQTLKQKIKENPADFIGNAVIKEDNFALLLSEKLKEKGYKYYWIWEKIKIGYEKFEEGIALFSLYPFDETESFCISKTNDENNWKTRKAIGINLGKYGWFYTTHTGWWDDREEPFKEQFKSLERKIKNKENVFLMGDFNSDSEVCSGGYEFVLNEGWYDSYNLALKKDDGYTATTEIDGWNGERKKIRIDYIFTNQKKEVLSSGVVFNGENGKVISDHFGVFAIFNI